MKFENFFRTACQKNNLNDNGRLAFTYLWWRINGEDVPAPPCSNDDLEGWDDWAGWTDALASADVLPDEKAGDIIPALRAVLCDEIGSTAYSFDSLISIIQGWKEYQKAPFVIAGRKLSTMRLYIDEVEAAAEGKKDYEPGDKQKFILAWANLFESTAEEAIEGIEVWIDRQSPDEKGEQWRRMHATHERFIAAKRTAGDMVEEVDGADDNDLDELDIDKRLQELRSLTDAIASDLPDSELG